MRKDSNGEKLRDERVGVVGENKHESLMEVVEYINSINIWVKFERGNKVHTTWKCFEDREVRNVYDKTLYGVGYLGEGDYKATPNRKNTSQYSVWNGMMQRCYDEEFKNKRRTYIDATICEEWHNFQNFAKWYDDNYYEISKEKVQLDKDILIKGNKIYSPETCIFVPQRINGLFIKNDLKRGDLPIGVFFHKRDKKYIARCSKYINGKAANGYLGSFDTKEEAFQVYKIHKERLIKQVANEYKGNIPDKLYQVMINYEVEITD